MTKETLDLVVTSNLSALTKELKTGTDSMGNLVEKTRELNNILQRTGVQGINIQELGRAIANLGKGSIDTQLKLSAARSLENTKKMVEYTKALDAAQSIDLRRGLKAYDTEKLKLAIKGQALLLAKDEAEAIKNGTTSSIKAVETHKTRIKLFEQELGQRRAISQEAERQAKAQLAALNKLKGIGVSDFGKAASSSMESYFSDTLTRGRQQSTISRAVNRRDIELAMANSNTVNLQSLSQEQLKVQLKAQQLLIDQAKARVAIAGTNENQRQLALEQDKLKAVQAQIEANKRLSAEQRKSTAAAERESKIHYDLNADVQRMGIKKSSEQYQRMRRELRVQETLGDGGATLFKIQAGLLANYTLMNSFFSTLSFGRQFVLELDASLRDLQAITATTEGNMEGLRQKLIEVSEGTRFTAVEVANAAKIMGQAGFSTQQIKDAIQGVVLLATATGSSLEEAADTATSVISVFQLRAEDMTHISNVMTEAINKSKLTMEKLALGIQYAGNIAAESGMTFEETTAVLGAMSNAGIKSGSTLGTGLRQVLIEMQNPTDKFVKNLKAVGLGIEDVDVRSKGFVTVMKTLRDAGFDTTRAFESFEVRSAAAFAAIQNNPDLITSMQEAFLNSNAAIEANATQMKSLSNSTSQLKNNIGLLINDLSGPFTTVLGALFRGLSSTIGLIREMGGALKVLGSILIGGGIYFAFGRLLLLLRNLLPALTMVNRSVGILGVTATSTGIAMRGLAALGATNPLGWLAIGLSVAATAMTSYSMSSSKLEESISSMKTELETLRGEYDKNEESNNSIGESLKRLRDRFIELKNNPEELRLEIIGLQNQFTELGFSLENGLTSNINEVISALENLQNQMNKMSSDQLGVIIAKTELLFREQAKLLSQDSTGPLTNMLDFNYSASDRSGFNKNEQVQFLESSRRDINQLSKELAYIDMSDSTKVREVQNRLQEFRTNNTARMVSVNKLIVELDKKTNKSRYEEKLLEVLKSGEEKNSDNMRMLIEMAQKATDISTAQATQISKDLQASDLGRKVAENISQFSEDIAIIKDGVSSNSPDKEKKEAVDKINDAMAELRAELMTQAAEILMGDIDMLSMNLVEEAALGDMLDQAFPEIATANGQAIDARDKLQGQIDEAKKKADREANAASRSAKNVFDKAAESLTALTNSFDEMAKLFDDQKEALQNLIDANSNINSSGYGKYGDAEIAWLKQMQHNANLGKIKTRLSQLPQAVDKADSVIMKNGGSATTIDANGYRSYTASNKDLNELIKKRNEYVRESNKLQAEYNALTGEATQKHLSYAEQIGVTIDEYKKQMEVQSSWSFDLKENLTNVFSNAGDAFSTMIEKFVTGSASGSEAIRGFATSVLESMLKIATNKLAGQLLGYAMSFIPSFGSSQTFDLSTNSGIATYLDATNGLNNGGLVRFASGGSAIGTRDSVPALLRPGEFVMRNQAVEAIGRQNLETMNAFGARYISQSASAGEAGSVSQSGGPTVLNVYVISPDQKPSLTKNDVVVTIADDLSRGGATKKLVKSIIAGA